MEQVGVGVMPRISEGKFSVQISSGTRFIFAKFSLAFSQSLKENVGIVPLSG
jgi:hypothetical protein